MTKRVFGFVSVVFFLVLVSSIIFMSCNKAEITARLYVGGYSTAKIYVINPDIEELVTTIDLPAGAQPDWLALSPDGSKLYCSSESQNRVHIVDTVNNSYDTSVAVGSAPRGIAFTPEGDIAAVVCINDNDIALIDTATATHSFSNDDSIVSIDVEGGIAIHPTLNKLYAAVYGGIGVADVEGNATVSTYSVSGGSSSLIDVVIHPDGSALFATEQRLPDSYHRFEVNQSTGLITGSSGSSVSDNFSLKRIGITPDGQSVYAPIYSGSRIDYFPASDISTINEIDLSPYLNSMFQGAQEVAFSDDSALAFVVLDDFSNDVIVVIQTSDNSVLGTINIPECDPRSIVYKP